MKTSIGKSMYLLKYTYASLFIFEFGVTNLFLNIANDIARFNFKTIRNRYPKLHLLKGLGPSIVF